MLFFNNHVGIRSSEQDLVGKLVMIRNNASSDTGEKEVSFTPEKDGVTNKLSELISSCLLSRSTLILSILSTKNFANLSAKSSAAV